MAEFGLELKMVFENGEEIKTYTLNELLPEAFVSIPS
jgi:cytidine deaminase